MYLPTIQAAIEFANQLVGNARMLYRHLCPQEQEGAWFCVQASVCTHHTGSARPPRTVRCTARDCQSCWVHDGTCYYSPFSWCRTTEIPHHTPVALYLIPVHHAPHMLQCCQLYRLHYTTWGFLYFFVQCKRAGLNVSWKELSALWVVIWSHRRG